jgi:FHS family L-fucose permease-like MFS transporter
MKNFADISDFRTGKADSECGIVPAGTTGTFVLITGLFFLWGIPNNLNDVLIRQFMKSFALSRFEAGLIQSAFYLGYFALALPAGLLMRKLGYKAGFLIGLMLFATGCFLFYPAAALNRYGLFLAALFILASGLAFLETAANPFIAQLGTTATSASRLNLAQAFNPIGSIIGVLVGTRFIFSGIELTKGQVALMKADGMYSAYLHGETHRVILPYMAIGSLAALWAVVIAIKKFPPSVLQQEDEAKCRFSVRGLFRSEISRFH